MSKFDGWRNFAGEVDIDGMNHLSPHLEMLPQLMDAAQLRHRVVSHNLANVNTPGYTRLDVQFEERLAEALGSSQPRISVPEIVKDSSGSRRADGNNVDLDRELGALNKNATLFQLYSSLLQHHYDTMRRATQTG